MKKYCLSLNSLCVVLLMIILGSCQSPDNEVSLSSMVQDMTKRSLVSEYPDPFFTVKQFSSYDQNTVAPDQDGWFANHDASWFIRQEENNGRREFVMLEAEGPGAIVRFWMTFGNKDAYTGTIRFYFDNSEEPEIEGPVLDIISGGALVGEPLSSSVSEETDYFKRGHNLYLPIPYNSHLKITYECPALKPENHSPSVYYNINYRSYEAGTSVISFTMDDLSLLKDEVEEVQKTLNKPAITSLNTSNLQSHSQKGILSPGKAMNLNIPGKAAIHIMQLKINAENLPQALRSTVLEIIFDGEKTVWAPIGEFFGTGYQIRANRTWYTQVNDDGSMSCYWLMPFKEGAQVTLTNYGDQEIEIVEQKVWTDKYRWTKNSMHFGAVWQELYEVESGGSSRVNGDDGHFDVNYVTLNGEGVYMGTGLTIFNTADAWWGEGDEKIWVDGESFPSFVGTGTEDYFGYAWCRPEIFSHFLIAQPDGSGNFHPGMSVNLRFHILDQIPFTSSIQFDLELWHWAKTVMNYAPMSYWYLKPGGSWNVKPDPEMVKKPVSLKRDDLIKPKLVEKGMLEGETLRVIEASHGDHQVQNISNFGWSGNSQLWWIADSDNATLTADFLMPESGQYKVKLVYSKAIDYANFRIALNDKYSPKKLVGYHDQSGKDVVTLSANLGIFSLKEGTNTLTLKTEGKHPKAVERYMVGIDYLKLVKIE
ncbi:MAG: DUF2961 domain-containing protein [Bacteroidetes bacterium]|jgi:hypothetical protein|nr:DUF2961 domain-containing protein [Bacteroidota bacterium]MBT3751369.1 DUF2961 domain-containing protein [Bacteroidota bacterium]MBT4401611.1 DUF2961 domain-containing protein [Bacteroidota bacterium]MBT4410175.1 DUF2961 domain-containing protein [Bacteroidota bacterium]MBT7093668.1 DUF2961 domain-containing protein [Bacteroidota bacterium]